MSGDQEAVRNAEANSQPDVSVTLEELFQELEREFTPLPLVQPGDMTRAIYAARYGISPASAAIRLEKFVAEGKLTRENKRAANGSLVVVYKKAE